MPIKNNKIPNPINIKGILEIQLGNSIFCARGIRKETYIIPIISITPENITTIEDNLEISFEKTFVKKDSAIAGPIEMNTI